MKKTLLAGIIAMTISLLFPVSVLAGPDQLDILGLIPGVSGRDQVQKAAVIVLGSDKQKIWVLLEIGGHRISCVAHFISSKLEDMTCLTGKNKNKDDYPTKASNIEIHEDLVEGFTKKFGEPDSMKRFPVRTNLGREIVMWTDKKGNELHLFSMFSRVDEGVIYLVSSGRLEKSKKEEAAAAAEAKKKF